MCCIKKLLKYRDILQTKPLPNKRKTAVGACRAFPSISFYITTKRGRKVQGDRLCARPGEHQSTTTADRLAPPVMNTLHSDQNRLWNFAVDRGGTFTDIIGIAPDGSMHVRKLLSGSDAYEDAGIDGIRHILGIGPELPLDSAPIGTIRIGTTVATNALLERKGTPLALCITEGFEDLLEIGNGTRPELFNLNISKPSPLYRHVQGVVEEIDSEGVVIRALDPAVARPHLSEIRKAGFEALAIVLKHAWINPVHERQLAALAREAGFTSVIASSEVMPLPNLLKRGQTTVIEAYLSTVLFSYIDMLRKHTGSIHLELMQSAGGLVPAAAVRAVETILSGPAGGVNALALLSRQLGLAETIGFDMGGTSTDVSRFGGNVEHVFESTVSGIPFHTDMLDVETVAAGGGSILSFDGMRMQVGPQSAGSDPGPACYGLGGPLTVTDANLMLGRMLPQCMPRTFGPRHSEPPDRQVTEERFTELAATVNRMTGSGYTTEELAAGYIRIANEIMCRAMKKISVSRGYDIRKHALICFGGASAQHACDIARLLDVDTIIVPHHSSVFSAYGIALADRIERAARSVMKPLSAQQLSVLKKTAEEMSAPLSARLPPRDDGATAIVTGFLDLRPAGTDSWLSLPFGTGTRRFEAISLDQLLDRFEQEYLDRFGFSPGRERIEVVNIRIELRRLRPCPAASRPQEPEAHEGLCEPRFFWKVWTDRRTEKVAVFEREQLRPGHAIDGPAMIVDDRLTLFVQRGFQTSINPDGTIILRDRQKNAVQPPTDSPHEKPDPVMLEVFNNLFMNIAEQMGNSLANTAHSVNMKERHDFSCALFDAEGRLVAHAPHIPVHLGAMEATVCHIIRKNRHTMKPGDMYMANDPHQGGSHLPDITIVAPVFNGGSQPDFFIANRGHHADIGGITPGSMPPSSRTITEEGVVISNFLLVRDGLLHEKEITSLLSSAAWPARNIPERISDLKAQIAANRKGLVELQRITAAWGNDMVRRYMEFLQENARQAMNRALIALAGEDKHFSASFADLMDNGAVIKASVTVRVPDEDRAGIVIDFSGTSDEDPSNINAPAAVTRAAVLYTLRCLIDKPIPLNAGCMDAVTIIIPEGSLLSPSSSAAVAVGNVETSQRIVDVLFGALGMAAASQGTMNNVLFGKADNSGTQYYETIPGGSGAIRGARGASGVQVHMTNTKITDPEILECRFRSVRVTAFRLRTGSGGQGEWNGGNGTERRFLFTEPMLLSVLSERRNHAPFGLNGGLAGKKGKNLLISADGRTIEIGHREERIIRAGETLVILTPGGGGFGACKET